MPVDTEKEFVLEIKHGYGEHIVEILATNVVPEFPIALLVMAFSMVSIIVFLAIKRRFVSSI